MRRFATVLISVIVATLACAPFVGATGERASGIFIDAVGNTIGAVELTQTVDGAVAITLSLRDPVALAAGQHGIHFHAVGKCEGPDFATAGAHFNPTGTQHGGKNPRGPHAGDLPNLSVAVAVSGGYAASLTTTTITLAAGPTGIFDSDGTTLVIHANPDDELTDPTGNSGGRVACAVLTPTIPGALPATGGGAVANRRALWQQVLLLATVTLACTGAASALGWRRAI